ncbi:hypothetical protein KEM48_001745 [Puccinia striiformis f. sp. tritici PST-130]|uniref:Uncharacterized protein n=2 Tax=Puccinia striiformis TaxID=27350 RepID=A0A0L0VFV7_9BASI|nr:hypothetical protein KEM48_001745 [Puccinia striiformis f. sp. tritici PST-130]KNE98076.1 hypothetical protein PSTG_08750 [Puccinia striiformis f. sp. tritici PST-78]POW13294.1 hypothetical protein PSTT_03863 [Puccinia striiformis]
MDVSEPSLSTQLTVLLETLQNLAEKYEWPTLQESGQEKEELEEKNKLLDKLDILDITSYFHSLQTPTQERYLDNPPLNQSVHNPGNGFIKTISKIFASPNPDGSIHIPADKVKTLSLLLEIEKITSV